MLGLFPVALRGIHVGDLPRRVAPSRNRNLWHGSGWCCRCHWPDSEKPCPRKTRCDHFTIVFRRVPCCRGRSETCFVVQNLLAPLRPCLAPRAGMAKMPVVAHRDFFPRFPGGRIPPIVPPSSPT